MEQEYKPELNNLLSEEELKVTEKNDFQNCNKCDGGYIGDKLCDCLKLEIMKRKYFNANVDYEFASLPIHEEDVSAYLKDDDSTGGKFEIDLNAFILEYVNSSTNNRSNGKGVLFAGPTGRGKSLSSMKTLMFLIDKGYSGYWITIKQYIEIVKKAWTEEESKNLLNHIYNCDFLVVDDLGVEYHKEGNDWALTEIDGLFRHRYFKKLPILGTTNSNLDQLKAKYAQRIISLFHERLMYVTIVSQEDYREKLSKLPDYMDANKFKKGGK